MSIEGQFRRLPVRVAGRELAFAGQRTGRGYLSDIRRFEMLERDQEFALAKRWREHGDRDAANQLVTSHLRLAAKVATSYRGYGLPISEVISEGNVGLMQALNRFDPEKRLSLRHLRDLVDQGFDTGLRSAFVVACENRHYRKPEEAFLQAALGATQNLGIRKRRSAPRSGKLDREEPQCHGARCR